jgi:hypothetical protein
MTNQQSAELSEPGVGALDDPTPLVTSQLSAIFEPPLFVVPPIRRNQFDTSPLPSLSQRIGIVAAIGNHPFRVLPRPTRGPRDADFGMRGVRKRNFCRRGTFQPNSQRNTLTVSQYHPLRALATLGFTNCFAPFFAGAKLPSKKASSHLNKPSASRAPARFARHTARRLVLPIAATGANRSKATDTHRAGDAMPHRSAEPTECLPDTPGSMPRDDPDCLSCAAAPETMARSVPTAHPSTASAAS